MTAEDPKWTRGVDLSFLREVAAAMRPDIKPHCYGAFGLPRERDIADAQAEGNLCWTRAGGNMIVAAAMFRVLASGSRHEDFAHRKATIKAGDLLIRQLGGTPEGKARLLDSMIGRYAGPTIWAEAHVENPETVALLESRGFARQMTKIAASSDLKGLWARGDLSGRAPGPLAIADRPALVCLDAAFISPTEREAVIWEAEQSASWAQHYSGYNKGRSWTAYALHGYDRTDPGFIIKPAEMSKQWKAENPLRLTADCGPTVAAEHFPAALKIADRLPGAKQRIRLMRLARGGGELTRHADITDPEAGTANGATARLHIPIQTDQRCQFRGWDLEGHEHRVHFPERALCYLDTRKPHAVINEGERDRIHLVVDCHSGPELRAMIAQTQRAGAS